MFMPHQNYQPWYFEAHVLQNYKIVCQAVVELTNLVNILYDKVSKLEHNEDKSNSNMRDDGNKHKSDPHAKRVDCPFCHEQFEEHWKLEMHIRMHEEAESFQCDVCNKIFHAKWRLKKHVKNHFRKDMKTCKYFKKGQFCPYQEVGCKFAHEAVNHTGAKENKPRNVDEEINHSEATDTVNDGYEKNAQETTNEVSEKAEDPADTESRSINFQCIECTGEYDCMNCIMKSMPTENLDDSYEESIESIMAKAKAFAEEDD